MMAKNVNSGAIPATSKDFESTKAAIFETFSKLKKWREEQVEQFRNMQRLESQRVIRLSDENQKHLQKILEQAAKSPEISILKKVQNIENKNTSLASVKNNFDCHDTTQESSITGHLQRCFDDSSQSNISASHNHMKFNSDVNPKNWAAGFTGSQTTQSADKDLNKPVDSVGKDLGKPKGFEIKIDATTNSTKPKRTFLRKGTGLLRYLPKSATQRSAVYANRVNGKVLANSENTKRKSHLPKKTLILKPAIRNIKPFEHGPTLPTENTKHIRFDIPSEIYESEVESSKPNAASANDIQNSDFQPIYRAPTTLSDDNSSKDKLDLSISGIESLNLSKENRELEEFELLENCAQNSSFNSDSSIVQKVLHGGNTKAIVTQKKTPAVSSQYINGVNSKDPSKTPVNNPIFSAKLGLNKCMEEVQARKQILQKVISDINPRIQSLQKEITNFNDESFEDSDVSERCSTPLEDLSVEERVSPPVLPENESSIQFPELPSSEVFGDQCGSGCKSCNVNDVLKDLYPNGDHFEEHTSVCESIDLSPENNPLMNDRIKIREKVQELEKEIQVYQGHNAKLSSICKERDEILKKLQKERQDFNKYKEAEKKKLEAEIEQERKQIRRQKETFTRYQKLRKDHPTRKEREELNALRQEVEKLQEELKRQRIKYTSDSRRWKNQLHAAEKERDSFKLENIRLEEQVQDLLTALKTRMKKIPVSKSFPLHKVNEENENVIENSPENEISEGHHSIPKQTESDACTKSDKVSPAISIDKKTKSKVRFDLKKKTREEADKNSGIGAEVLVENQTYPKEIIDIVCDTQPVENAVCKPQPEEIRSAKDLIENQFNDQDIVFNLHDTHDNNDHDETMYCRNENDFLAANISTITVSLEAEYKEIDHGNKIERIHNTGEREIIFNSGTRKIISADGKSTKFMFYNGDTKEIFSDKREIYRYVNGVVETRFPDGLEMTEFPNGQIQRRYPDGQKEVKFPDGTMHNIYADGSEEIQSSEGNVVNLSADGTETIEFANGQKEIRTATYKRREFPDGSVKIVYDSGRQETRYANGRIRIKDKEGKVIVDTKYLSTLKD